MSVSFLQAVEAITTGGEARLRALLQSDAGLVHQRAPFAHRATLLHYLGANGVEVQRSPQNAPAIARILLDAGALPDATAAIYGDSDTTLCMTVTSVVPYLAGVQADLVDALVDYGANVDGPFADGAPLGCALLFGYTEAAERLVLRGARFDNLIYAAGLGRADVVSGMLAAGATGARSGPDRGRHARPFVHFARLARSRRGRECDALLPPECAPLCGDHGARGSSGRTSGARRGCLRSG